MHMTLYTFRVHCPWLKFAGKYDWNWRFFHDIFNGFTGTYLPVNRKRKWLSILVTFSSIHSIIKTHWRNWIEFFSWKMNGIFYGMCKLVRFIWNSCTQSRDYNFIVAVVVSRALDGVHSLHHLVFIRFIHELCVSTALHDHALLFELHSRSFVGILFLSLCLFLSVCWLYTHVCPLHLNCELKWNTP